MNSSRKLVSCYAERQKRHRQERPLYKGMKAELTIKLIVCWVITIAALASAVKLFPYHLSQRDKLKELENQVAETESRVVQLRQQLNRNFDPQQTHSLMEEYSSRVAPNRSRIFLIPEGEIPSSQN